MQTKLEEGFSISISSNGKKIEIPFNAQLATKHTANTKQQSLVAYSKKVDVWLQSF